LNGRRKILLFVKDVTLLDQEETPNVIRCY